MDAIVRRQKTKDETKKKDKNCEIGWPISGQVENSDVCTTNELNIK